MDRTPLTEADDYIREMTTFITEVQGVDDEEAQRVVNVLEWHLKIAKQHYRNLLHCYSFAAKGSSADEVD